MLDKRSSDASAAAGRDLMRGDTAIVPKHSIPGRALIAVIAIMTFLASLTTGAVLLVRAAADDWQAEVAREVTVQVRPMDGRDLDADVNASVGIIRAVKGVAGVHAYSKAEAARLLEPWLGKGMVLDDLPVPRLIVVRLSPGASPDFQSLRQSLAATVPGASLDDHRGWIERMRVMSGTVVFGGIVVLLVMLVATVLSVSFATQGAMATNRPTIEVLHFIGARNDYIAARFQRHFLILGLQGGAIGAGAAAVLFGAAQIVVPWFNGSAAQDQITALFGRFSLGWSGYIAFAGQIMLMSVITALTSRYTVNRTLDTVE